VFDKLVDVLLQFLDKFAFIVIVDAYEQVIVLRLGRYNRTLMPGPHWIWPFAETAISENVVSKVYDLNAQSLTTKDGVSIVVSGIVTARVHDVRKALLGVEGVTDAIKNASVAEIARAVAGANWEELTTPQFGYLLTGACRRRGFKWGMEIDEVQLSDVSKSRSIRLFHDYGMVKS
jgi:regulator of protease activity HflC (stomatin/prohibitin superfamily)